MSGSKMFENFLFNYNMTFIKFTKVGLNERTKRQNLTELEWAYFLFHYYFITFFVALNELQQRMTFSQNIVTWIALQLLCQ